MEAGLTFDGSDSPITLNRYIILMVILSSFLKIFSKKCNFKITYSSLYKYFSFISVFLIWVFISLSWSPDFDYALDKFFRYALNITFTFVMLFLISSRLELQNIAIAVVLGSLVTFSFAYNEYISSFGVQRAEGLGSSANAFGQFCVISIVFCLGYFLGNDNKKRVVALLLIFVFLQESLFQVLELHFCLWLYHFTC